MMMKRWFVLVLMMKAITWQGCESEVEPAPVDCNVNPVILDLVSGQDSDCSLMNGSIEVVASGGSGEYRYALGTGTPQSGTVFTALAAGLYEIKALDENDCAATLEVNVKNKNGVNITLDATAAGCGTSNAALTVTAVDGTEPYQFKLGDGDFTPSNTFPGLHAGNYNVIAKDATGCEVSTVAKVRSGISFAGSIKTIIENNCAVSGCHNGTQFPDFRVFKNIQDHASQVKKLTQDRTMPDEGSLTQEQIDMIACWVDDGALNN